MQRPPNRTYLIRSTGIDDGQRSHIDDPPWVAVGAQIFTGFAAPEDDRPTVRLSPAAPWSRLKEIFAVQRWHHQQVGLPLEA